VTGVALAGVMFGATTAAAAPPVPLGVAQGRRDPGCALLVRSAGRTVLAAGYGVRALGSRAPLDVHSNFRLASVSKQFTAMAVMLLVADGRLSYDATLADLLPGFPDYARRVTVRHLLTHTAGLPDYEDLMDAEERAGGPAYTPQQQIQDGQVLELLQRQPMLRFEPGSQWAYSNSAYVLLGLIVGRLSGRPFGEFLAARIFTPLGMHDTRLYVRGRNSVPKRAYGHEPGAQGLVPADQSSTSATQGDGGVYSNIADLARWDAALESHALLPASAMDAAYEPVRLADGGQTRWPETGDEDNLAPGQPVAYGFGWFLDPVDGQSRRWHFGTTRGFRSAIMRFPERRLTTVVLCNRTDIDAREVALRLARHYMPTPGPGR
jgi:CubicO group peptidase (beta-lactamase class C family)